MSAVRIAYSMEMRVGNSSDIFVKGNVMTNKELLQENDALRDLLLRIRNRIDAELEKLDEDTDAAEGAEFAEDDE